MDQQITFDLSQAKPIPPPIQPRTDKPKTAISFDLSTAKPVQDNPPPSTEDLHALTAQPNPDKPEGLYRMKAADGRVYGVPFSRVDEAHMQHNMEFEDKEEGRYDHDFEDVDHPGVVRRLQKRGDKWLEDNTGPNAPRDNRTAAQLGLPPDATREQIAEAQRKKPLSTEWINSGVTGLAHGAGSVLLHPVKSIAGAAEGISDAADAADVKLRDLGIEPGKSTPENLEAAHRFNSQIHDAYHSLKSDPAYTVGDLVGQGEMLGEFQKLGVKGLEVPGKVVAKAPEAATAAGKTLTRTGRTSTEKLVREAGAYNEDRLPEEQAKVRAENDKLVEKATTKTEKAHAEKVQKVRAENVKKVQKHVDDVLAVTTENQRILNEARAAHEAETHRIETENAAGAEAEKAHQKASETAHQEKVEATEKANKEAEAAHAKAIEDQAELERQRKLLNRRDLRQRGNVYRWVKKFQTQAKGYFDREYRKIDEATEGHSLPLSTLVDGVYAATKHVEGSRTTIPIFNDIIKRGKGVDGPKLTMRDAEGYDDLAPDERAIIDHGGVTGVGQEISYKDLRGYDRELGKVIGSPSQLPDIRNAAIHAQDIVREMMQDIADKAGPETGEMNRAVREKYRNYAEAFKEHAGPSSSGSLVAQSAKAAEAYHGTEPFRNLQPEEVDRLREMIANVGEKTSSPEIARKLMTSIERLWKIDEDARSMPKPSEPKPPKLEPPPEFKLLPKPPKPFTPKPTTEFEPPTPAGKRIREIPPPPELEPEPKYTPPEVELKDEPKPKTVTEKEAVAEKKARIRKRIDFLENSAWARSGGHIAGVGSAVLLATSLLRGADMMTLGLEAAAGAGATVATIMGRQMLADFLKKPWVENALTKLTKADMDALERMTPSQRNATLSTLTALSQEAKRTGVVSKNTSTPWTNVMRQERKNPGSVFPTAAAVIAGPKKKDEPEDEKPREPDQPSV